MFLGDLQHRKMHSKWRIFTQKFKKSTFLESFLLRPRPSYQQKTTNNRNPHKNAKTLRGFSQGLFFSGPDNVVGLKTIFYHPFSPFAGCWESTLELLESSSTWVRGVLVMAISGRFLSIQENLLEMFRLHEMMFLQFLMDKLDMFGELTPSWFRGRSSFYAKNVSWVHISCGSQSHAFLSKSCFVYQVLRLFQHTELEHTPFCNLYQAGHQPGHTDSKKNGLKNLGLVAFIIKTNIYKYVL